MIGRNANSEAEERCAKIIGKSIMREAQKFPDFLEKLKQALNQIVTDEEERQVLKTGGYL